MFFTVAGGFSSLQSNHQMNKYKRQTEIAPVNRCCSYIYVSGLTCVFTTKSKKTHVCWRRIKTTELFYSFSQLSWHTAKTSPSNNHDNLHTFASCSRGVGGYASVSVDVSDGCEHSKPEMREICKASTSGGNIKGILCEEPLSLSDCLNSHDAWDDSTASDHDPRAIHLNRPVMVAIRDELMADIFSIIVADIKEDFNIIRIN